MCMTNWGVTHLAGQHQQLLATPLAQVLSHLQVTRLTCYMKARLSVLHGHSSQACIYHLHMQIYTFE